MNDLLRLLCLCGALCCAAPANATFSKIANNGAELPDSATLGSGPDDWACTRDNDTGLIWEVKTNDGGWRDQDNTYTNFDSHYGTPEQIAAADNSIGFVNAINAAVLCGYGEWRMPSKEELAQLATTSAPAYFPNTRSWYVWSGSPDTGHPDLAWLVYSGDGSAVTNGRGDTLHLRLVRGGSSFPSATLSVAPVGEGVGVLRTGGIECVRLDGIVMGHCETTRGIDSVVTLTAVPASGSRFAGWRGACSGDTPACTLTMDAAKSVTAEFSRPQDVSSIVSDPAAPGTLYAAIDGAGIYRSIDAGANWASATIQPTDLRIKALVLADELTLYAATLGNGVFKSTDAGLNWSACPSQPDNPRLHTLARTTHGTLYAGSESGIHASDDGCRTWHERNSGLPR